jgi:hypothetical protein
MRRRSRVQALRSSALILCCASFAYLAKTSGFSDLAVVSGTTVIGAVVLGCLWRWMPDDSGDGAPPK